MKLADMPSYLGGEGSGKSTYGARMCLTTSWRFDSFSYSNLL